nr:MAG TPA: hypothetical protein [Caudoviricetes sp.]
MGISYLGWMQTWLRSAQVARHGYDTICDLRLELVCLISYNQAVRLTAAHYFTMEKCVNV